MYDLRPSIRLLATTLLLHSLQITCNAAAQCYYPNGDQADDSPCDPDAEVSACCGGSLGNACLSNNLCRSSEGDTIRGSCTDDGWGDGCPVYCTGQSTGGTDLISCSNVTHTDTSYCCDHVQAGCCDSGVGRFDVLPSNAITTATWNVAKSQFVVIATPTSSLTISSSTTSSSTSTSSSAISSSTSVSSSTIGSISLTPTSQPITNDNTASTAPTSLSMGAKVGIGIGVGLGSLLLAALAYLIWLLRKKNNAAQQQSLQESPPAAGQKPAEAYEYPKWTPPQELSNEPMNPNLRYELPVAP